jgi:hypothetical protein
MMTTPPKFLYKYMGKRLDRIGDILVNRRLHFSDPLSFNDPFDCALGLDLRRSATDQDWVEYFIHLVEEDSPATTPNERRKIAIRLWGQVRHSDICVGIPVQFAVFVVLLGLPRFTPL